MSKKNRFPELKKNRFPELKQEIRQREAASRLIRQRIRVTSHMDRWEAWQEKRHHGSTTRCLLLIYGLLRGVPHWVVENHYSPTALPWLARAMHHMAKDRSLELSQEQIEAWLVEAPASEAVA